MDQKAKVIQHTESLEDEGIANTSGNRPFHDVLSNHLSRRTVVRGGLVAAAAFMAPTVVAGGPSWSNGRGRKARELLGFQPVTLADAAASDGKQPLISAEYEYQVIIPWGTPIEPGVPEYDGDPAIRPTSAEQARQIGIGHDGMWFFPERARGRQSSSQGTLCINHEFGSNPHVLGKDFPESLEDVRLSQHAHGVSVVSLREQRGKWRVVYRRNNRRIHVNTPVKFSGPVARSAVGSDLLQLKRGDFKGTVNNCSSGYTPWGTYLTCEENFNGYFGATGDWTATPEQARYGFSTNGFFYGWHFFDPRFDLSQDNGEDNRFGWVVEIDPERGWKRPVKRTALGRFKHEGAEVTVGRGGRVVVYMGDDQRFDYIYKFVSAGNWKSMRARGISPLDEGKLYVARFDDDGTGKWLELTIDNPALAARFADQAEVLVYARIAADLLGATPMDRPEWTSVSPDGYCYCTLTNNTQRTVANAANPLAPNPDGHIIRWKDSAQFTGTSFTWDIFLIAEDTHGTEESFASPDGIWADPDGRLFIETDGDQKDGLNNQLLVSDTKTGEVRRLLVGLNDDEITGLTVTPDRRTLFANTQHPGNGDPSLTNFPAATDGVTIPRDATFVIRRKDGGTVGF